jgi:hypothetical protein
MRQDSAYLLPLSALETRGAPLRGRLVHVWIDTDLDDDGYSGAPALGLSPDTFLSHSACLSRYFCCFLGISLVLCSGTCC